MPDPSQGDSPIRFNATDRGFNRGEFYDQNGVECSIQESSLATAGAAWVGPNESVDGQMHTPDRMHIAPDEYNTIIGPLEEFASSGKLPEKPIVFRDYYGVPCCMSAASTHEMSVGIVLPKKQDGTARIAHDTNLYAANQGEVAVATKLMLDGLRNGSNEMVEIDNRMVINRRLASALATQLRQMIADGEIRSIDDG